MARRRAGAQPGAFVVSKLITGFPRQLRSFVLAQHSQNYLTATTLGGTRYATMSAAGKKNKLKMKYPMKL